MKTLKQTTLLSLYSTLVLIKVLISPAGSSAADFAHGALRFWEGTTPYAPPIGHDYFKYSPLFALFYSLYAHIPPIPQATLWGLTNIVFFWLGVSLWFPITKKMPKSYWAAIILCTMEMDGPIRHLQMNAFLIGAVLTCLYLYKERNYFGAAVFLVPICSFKAYFLVIPALLALGREKKFLLGAITGATLTFFLPALHGGISHTIWLHAEWVKMLLDNAINGVTSSDGQGAIRMLSLSAVLKHLGFEAVGKFLSLGVTLFSLYYLVRQSFLKGIDWNVWIPLLFSWLLLFSPGTERPTFVLLVPSFLFLLRHFETDLQHRRFHYAVLIASGFFLSIVYNDIWPKFIPIPGTSQTYTKTLAAFLIWALTAREVRRA